MDSALRPRDIQARIRSGRSVDEVAAAAGMSTAMVERFAAPVLAEREYVAGQAMSAPVRRRGEPSGQRKLRVAISDRLSSKQVDIDDVGWDSARMEDGRWAVIARYRLDETDHEAVFHFDVGGRFSVVGNTEARWLLGEDVDAADDEPTLEIADDRNGDRNDDMALVRSVAEPVRAAPIQPDRVETVQSHPQRVADAAPLGQAVTEPATASQPVVAAVPDLAPDPGDSDPGNEDLPDEDADEPTGGIDVLYDILDRAGTEYTEDSVEIPARTSDHEPATSEPDDRVAQVVSDAAAVPDTVGGDYAPATSAADFPVEPSLFDEEPGFTTPPPPEPAGKRRRRARTPEPAEPTSQPTHAEPAADVSPSARSAVDAPVETASNEPTEELVEQPEDDQPETPGPVPDDVPAQTARKKGRKRASVPSWDEIMFGSPRSKG